MAVFTPLTNTQVSDFLQPFDAGKLTYLEEVASGTENSTFFVTTDQHQLVLTLFEQGESEELPFFVELLDYLARHGLPVTDPLADKNGTKLQQLANRPALLLPRLSGTHPMEPTLEQCSAIGTVLGKIHHVSSHFPGIRPNPRDLGWIKANYQKVMAYLSADDQRLMLDVFDHLEDEIGYAGNLPQGALHGDLFRDNAMFDGNTLTGLIDFYNGCTGDLLFDLAIVVNDWCSDEHGTLIKERYDTVLNGYIKERPLTAEERQAWAPMLRMTALRYWLSRLLVVYVDPPAHSLTPKNPAQYRDLLLARVTQQAPALP